MFKRSLTAVAVLGVLAGSAFATDVQMYGVLDTGFAYTRVKAEGTKATNSYEMSSGLLSGSRIGVKGKEDLGNGMSVGFKLEGGLDTTNGDSKLFKREATINLAGDFGTFYAGRMGVLRSSAGSVGFANIDPLGVGSIIGGFDNVRGGFETRIDNAVAYVSPEFLGMKLYGMYGMGKGDQNKSSAKNRYAGLGLQGNYGPLQVVGSVDSFLKDKAVEKDGLRAKNEYQFNLGASYDFGVVTPYLQAAFFKNSTKINNMITVNEEGKSAMKDIALTDKDVGAYFNGFGLQLAATAPVGPGTLVGSVGYAHVNAKNAKADSAEEKLCKLNRWNLGAAYLYSLSKRTTVYVGAGWLHDEIKNLADDSKVKGNAIQAGLGLKHTF